MRQPIKNLFTLRDRTMYLIRQRITTDSRRTSLFWPIVVRCFIFILELCVTSYSEPERYP